MSGMIENRMGSVGWSCSGALGLPDEGAIAELIGDARQHQQDALWQPTDITFMSFSTRTMKKAPSTTFSTCLSANAL